MRPHIFFMVFLGYFVSFLLYFMNFESQKETLYHIAKRVALLTLSFHSAFLLITFVKTPHFLLTNLSGTIEMLSFLILTVSFVIESRSKAKFLMLFSLPIVLVFCLFAIVLVEQKDSSAVASGSGWLWLHLSFILTGFSSLIIAVSSALMYLLQSAQLKSKHPGKIFLKLPALDTLDRIHFRALAWGVILFSLGSLMGFLWVKNANDLKQVLRDPTVILSFVTCLIYWVILSFRLSALRRGQKIAISTILVFVLIFLTLLTSSIGSTGFHRGF